jgi:hypothetical protein
MIVSQRKKDETRKIKVLLIGGDVIGKALRKSRQALSLSNQKDLANNMHYGWPKSRLRELA